MCSQKTMVRNELDSLRFILYITKFSPVNQFKFEQESKFSFFFILSPFNFKPMKSMCICNSNGYVRSNWTPAGSGDLTLVNKCKPSRFGQK